ncbi:MAG: hypothetical protein L3V56_03700 [Candidatus Magnetoovum sp. WYHC-5]|nr:hypothetical protein [Candidatus Magnetoovum sp. WYHC-5]
MTKKRQKLSKNHNVKKNSFLTAYKRHMGHIGKACQDIGIHRATYRLWMQHDPEFSEEIHSICELHKDTIESIFYNEKLLKEHDTASMIFYLKTKCRDRGYAEKVDAPAAEVKIINRIYPQTENKE